MILACCVLHNISEIHGNAVKLMMESWRKPKTGLYTTKYVVLLMCVIDDSDAKENVSAKDTLILIKYQRMRYGYYINQ